MKINVFAICIVFTLLVSCNGNDVATKSTHTDKKEASQKPKDKVIATKDQRPIDQRGGEFTLFGKEGAVSLSDFKGKAVAIYFGYTQCPDVCPTNLVLLSIALKQLNEEELKQFQGIFISVDPGRDSPDLLAKYTQFFHPKIIGLSGAPDDLDPIAAKYGAYYEKVSYSNSALLYGISHTSETYIVGKNGKLMAIMPHAAPAEDIAQALRSAMK
ncbi:MAG: SCO family protein [Cocleimonas sp.]|nr:SCO family protein [Cocleimonas sp.]